MYKYKYRIANFQNSVQNAALTPKEQEERERRIQNIYRLKTNLLLSSGALGLGTGIYLHSKGLGKEHSTRIALSSLEKYLDIKKHLNEIKSGVTKQNIGAGLALGGGLLLTLANNRIVNNMLQEERKRHMLEKKK